MVIPLVNCRGDPDAQAHACRPCPSGGTAPAAADASVDDSAGGAAVARGEPAIKSWYSSERAQSQL
jgi:hypothetical protein